MLSLLVFNVFTQGSTVQKVLLPVAKSTKAASKKKVGAFHTEQPPESDRSELGIFAAVGIHMRNVLLQPKAIFNEPRLKSILHVTLQDEDEDPGEGWDEWAQGKALIKPPDQLELSEAVRDLHCSTLGKAILAVLRELAIA